MVKVYILTYSNEDDYTRVFSSLDNAQKYAQADADLANDSVNPEMFGKSMPLTWKLVFEHRDGVDDLWTAEDLIGEDDYRIMERTIDPRYTDEFK